MDVPPAINDYGANGLEEALHLTKDCGARVAVVGLSDDSSGQVLRQALALGADAAMLPPFL